MIISTKTAISFPTMSMKRFAISISVGVFLFPSSNLVSAMVVMPSGDSAADSELDSHDSIVLEEKETSVVLEGKETADETKMSDETEQRRKRLTEERNDEKTLPATLTIEDKNGVTSVTEDGNTVTEDSDSKGTTTPATSTVTPKSFESEFSSGDIMDVGEITDPDDNISTEDSYDNISTEDSYDSDNITPKENNNIKKDNSEELSSGDVTEEKDEKKKGFNLGYLAALLAGGILSGICSTCCVGACSKSGDNAPAVTNASRNVAAGQPASRNVAGTAASRNVAGQPATARGAAGQPATARGAAAAGTAATRNGNVPAQGPAPAQRPVPAQRAAPTQDPIVYALSATLHSRNTAAVQLAEVTPVVQGVAVQTPSGVVPGPAPQPYLNTAPVLQGIIVEPLEITSAGAPAAGTSRVHAASEAAAAPGPAAAAPGPAAAAPASASQKTFAGIMGDIGSAVGETAASFFSALV